MKNRLLGLVFLFASSLPLSIPASAQDTASEVRISRTGDQGGLTPYDYNTGCPGHIMMSLIYGHLLWFGPDGSLVPWRASDYTSHFSGRRTDSCWTWAQTGPDGRALRTGGFARVLCRASSTRHPAHAAAASWPPKVKHCPFRGEGCIRS